MIIYPNLLKNVSLLENYLDKREICFWKKILERLSICDTPFNTEIRNNRLYHKDNSISLTTSKESDIIQFFRDVIGMKLTFINYYSWKNIKKKSTKDDLIYSFVMCKKKQYNLSTKEHNILLSFIHLNITLKLITHENIILKVDGHTFIENINNLYIEKNDNGMNVYLGSVIFITDEYLSETEISEISENSEDSENNISTE